MAGFVGRQAELAALFTHAQAARRQRTLRIVVVLAPPRYGATRLLHEFLAAQPGLRRVRGSVIGGESIGSAPRLGLDVAGRSSADELAVLVLDRWHETDEATVSALVSATPQAGGGPGLVLVAAWPGLDERIPDGPAVHLLWLPGLSASETNELLTGLVGWRVPADLADQVHRRTDGSPALITAVAGQIRREDSGRDRLAIRWPEAVRCEVDERLRGLGQATAAILRVAAVIGREFDLSVLERVVGAGAVAAIEVATTGGVLRPLPGRVFGFVDAVTREICYDALGLQAAAAWHERIGSALTEVGPPAGERAPTIAELAHHFVHASVLGGSARLDHAIAATVAAARAAQDAGDSVRAAADYAVAVELAGRAGWPAPSLGRLLVALGAARLANGEVTAGRSALGAATRLGHRAGDGRLLAAAAFAYGPPARRDELATPPDEARLAALAGALACVADRPDAPAATLVRLRARLAMDSVGDVAQWLAEGALATAQECADRRALAEALLAAPVPTVVQLRQAIREATALGDRALLVRAHQELAAALLRAGDVGAADRALGGASDAGDPTGGGQQAQAHRALLAGRLPEAMRQAAAARSLVGDHRALLRFAATVTSVAMLRGEPKDLAAALAAVPAPRPLWIEAAQAWVDLRAGAHGLARDLSGEFGDGPLDGWAISILALALTEQPPDVENAAPQFACRLLEALGPIDRGWLVVGSGATSAGPRALHAARLAIAAGELGEADQYLTVAQRAVGETPWRPWWHLERARWFLAVGESEAGGQELKTARAGAVARGLSGLVALADTAAAAVDEPLTGREQEVLSMALAGATVRVIADRLGVGIRTIETHIAHIYRKVGVRSRVELMARFSPPALRPGT